MGCVTSALGAITVASRIGRERARTSRIAVLAFLINASRSGDRTGVTMHREIKRRPLRDNAHA